jgi:hypothetical protein
LPNRTVSSLDLFVSRSCSLFFQARVGEWHIYLIDRIRNVIRT